MLNSQSLNVLVILATSIHLLGVSKAHAAQFLEFDPLSQSLPANSICIDLRVRAEQVASKIDMTRLAELLGCSKIANVQLSVTADEMMTKRAASKIARLADNPLLLICSKGVRSETIADTIGFDIQYLSLTGGVEYLVTIEDFLPIKRDE